MDQSDNQNRLLHEGISGCAYWNIDNTDDGFTFRSKRQLPVWFHNLKDLSRLPEPQEATHRNAVSDSTPTEASYCNPYRYADLDSSATRSVQDTFSAEPSRPKSAPRRYSRLQVEKIARDLLNDLYRNEKPNSKSLMALLDPSLAAAHLGITFVLEPGLGTFRSNGVDIEVGGLLDRNVNKISVSRRTKQTTHRFTAAHEIGHWLLHPGEVFHRDIPIESPKLANGKQHIHEAIETEANWFAAYFLMPRTMVTYHFTSRFGVNSFSFTSEQIAKLGSASRADWRLGKKDLKHRALVLATAERYENEKFISLAEEFGVSPSAMAFQLMDFGLVR